MARIKQHTEAMAKTYQEEIRVLRRMCKVGTF